MSRFAEPCGSQRQAGILASSLDAVIGSYVTRGS